MSHVIVVIGAGSIGQAIARRVSAGKHVVLADLHQANADAAAEVLGNAGFEVSTTTVDVSSRASGELRLSCNRIPTSSALRLRFVYGWLSSGSGRLSWSRRKDGSGRSSR
jgi:NAD(P)-dependent dehydrogenase (short-subunit alcohol dehydrogenase family)